jgi:protein SCO1/2
MAALLAARDRSSLDRHCCADVATALPTEPQPIAASAGALSEVELENQDGVRARFADIFGGRPCLIAFFYTRCMNPDKCSRTISKLARVYDLVEQRLPGSAVTVAAISYDPAYDLPERLRRYGDDRGLRFGARCHLLRTTGAFAPIRAGLQLGVGYGSATVNRHRIELVLLDATGKVADSKVRRVWDENGVVDTLVALDATSGAREGRAACCAS